MTIPPMPDPSEYRDEWGTFQSVAFQAALDTWERVAKHLIDQMALKPAPPQEDREP